MLAQRIPIILLISFLLAPAAEAQVTDSIKEYFSETAAEVKAESDPVRKREILGSSLENMMTALDRAEKTGLVTEKDREGFDQIRATVQEKHAELAGANGFDPVPDGQLNSFADYVSQDMEQADRTITISLASALLILIIVILLA